MSKNKDLFINPADVLIFRDGRPFSAGDDHKATGVFPPAPTSFYGALRATALARNGVSLVRHGFHIPDTLTQEFGGVAELGTMRIAHYSLAHRLSGNVTPLYTLPADVLKIKKDGDTDDSTTWQRVKPHAFSTQLNPLGNFPGHNQGRGKQQFLWKKRDERKWYEYQNAYLSQADFLKYLKGEESPSLFPIDSKQETEKDTDPVFLAEPRTSVSIDAHSGTSKEGMLFTVDFTRLNQSIGFAIRIANSPHWDKEEQGWLRLGGEARAASFSSCVIPDIETKCKDKIAEEIKKTGRFTVVLSTQAPFEKGWLPDFVDERGEGEINNSTFHLVGASLRRPELVGGWDLVRNCPRPARKAVAAGSVYFFEGIEEKAVDPLLESMFNMSVCNDVDDKKLGLGIAFVGVWNNNGEV